MHNTIVHHPLASDRSAAPAQLPSVYTLGMMFCGVEDPFDQFKSTVLDGLPFSFLCTCLFAGHRKQVLMATDK